MLDNVVETLHWNCHCMLSTNEPNVGL